MKKISNILFSMETMGILILIFAAAIGVATFIENDFGVAGSKSVVYNATWFSLLLLWLSINLVVNIFRYKMWRPRKLTMFMFHFSFLVIILGAAITRYISYEGSMHIREGSSSNIIVSDDTFVEIELSDGTNTVTDREKVLLSVLRPDSYGSSASIGNKKFKFEAVNYIPNAKEVITEMPTGGKPYMVVVVSAGMGRETIPFEYNSMKSVGERMLIFGDEFQEGQINVRLDNGNLMINTPDTIITTSMMGLPADTLIGGNWHPFEMRKLYQLGNTNLVLTNVFLNGVITYQTYSGNDASFMDALVVEVSNGNETKTVYLKGGKGYSGETVHLDMNGVHIDMTYGAQKYELPFSLALEDFELERYPGSMSPSSYASDVILIDEADNVNMPYRIYMNHVLNYKGYRFFQSSYDRDELGTVLSVNHDYWGTFFTYVGYFLMTLGMFLTLFNKYSRFSFLGRLLEKNHNKAKSGATAILIMLMLISPNAFSQHNHGQVDVKNIPPVNKEQAAKFGDLLVQSQDGRLKPMNTLSGEVLRKISRNSKMFGMNADQVLLGMLSQPQFWQQVPMIKVSDKEIKDMLGIEGSYASYMDFIDINRGAYKLKEYVEAAYAKKPAQRGMFDKEVMKVDERLNICYLVFTGDFLKVMPDPRDSHNPWFIPGEEVSGISKDDSLMIRELVPAYLEAIAVNNLSEATQYVEGIAKFQKKYGADIMPSENKVSMEILYNKLLIFDNLSKLYGLLGFILLILLFVEMFRKSKIMGYVVKGLIALILVGFFFQTAGLAMRWYISGHAPWSDGYESLIYIGWVTMLAGLIFSRKSQMALAATTVLASIILMVAHLSWMDPEITNLVPVLKSYWLTIHVSIITASYGFLALSMLLGFLNLFLMIIKNKKNFSKIDNNIADLTIINERSMMIGLYMLTIGTFLGGVWANESWGRYWGWDPKETWALVSVLVYSFILHMEYIPGLRTKFTFNFASLISYAVIMMTYFGVNYYLSGLHSYAKGDPVPVPMFVYYIIVVVAIVSLWAYFNNRRFPKEQEVKE
ncbi:MAG TPA: cytochrome c biogenesis protein CcsA [Bacteroidales bacterium]